MNEQNKKIIWIVGGIIAALVIIGGALMLASGGSVGGARSEIVFMELDNKTNVFIDNERQTLKTSGDTKSVYVASGHRDILVSKDGYWPWLKQIDTKAGEATRLAPFLFPKKPLAEVVGQDDPEYDALVSMVSGAQVPTEPNVIVSKDGNVTIWNAGSALKAKWIGKNELPAAFCFEKCENEITIVQTTASVQSLAFWQGRNDLVIVAAGTDIYALELDRRPVQNYQPIIKGVRPSFAFTKTGDLYAQDNHVLYHLSLNE